jgi:hypothetical protein
MFDHRSAGKKRTMWPTFVVAMTAFGARSDPAWAIRITSAPMVLSPAVCRSACRANAQSSPGRPAHDRAGQIEIPARAVELVEHLNPSRRPAQQQLAPHLVVRDFGKGDVVPGSAESATHRRHARITGVGQACVSTHSGEESRTTVTR